MATPNSEGGEEQEAADTESKRPSPSEGGRATSNTWGK